MTETALSEEHVLVDDRDGTRTITLNRPEAKNAMTLAMRTRLCDLLTDAEMDTALRVVIVTAVDPVFTAGVDFREVADQSGPTMTAFDRQFAVNPGRALRALSTPVICAVNGACVSGGLEIALSSTFVIASDRARFADTHARLGVVPGWGLSALLPRTVGVRKAAEMSITGNFVEAHEALRLGIVNHVVAHDELGDFTRRLAADVADTPAVAEVLRLYRLGEGRSLSDALALESDHVARRTHDPAEFARKGRETAARGKPSSVDQD